MSVGLYYDTTTEVPAELCCTILRDTIKIVAAWDWWTDSLYLERSKDAESGEFRLGGWHSIWLSSYELADGTSIEVDGDEDNYMTWVDAWLVLHYLALWSRKHQLTWRVHLEGDAECMLRPETIDADLATALSVVAEKLGVAAEDRIVRAPKVLALRAKHPQRRTPTRLHHGLGERATSFSRE